MIFETVIFKVEKLQFEGTTFLVFCKTMCGCGFAPLRDLVWLLVAEGDGLEEAETDGRGLIEVDMRPVFASPDDTTLPPICWCGLVHALC